jgi:formate--tetrahydrofolate ligase
VKSDIEIAQNAEPKPIEVIAEGLSLGAEDLMHYGRHIAKVPLNIGDQATDRPMGKLILVTAMTPPPQGAGKTTTTIGLAQALAKCGHRSMAAIREPSLGPCMGMKGGAAGGGYSQVLPMEEINLHFTGDLHAVTMAHNLCAAVVDNHLHQGASPEIHPRRVIWKRVIDMNDRSLRNTIVGLLDQGVNGVMREDGFEITAASEVMAILCLATDQADLKRRIGNIIVGYDALRRPVTVSQVGVQGAMAALLKHAIHPNLVQTIEGTAAFVHGGPFANIAHGCNSLVATRLALHLADYVVTEAGFGADLGAEKFFHIKCRTGELRPAAAVIVVPKRGYDCHGLQNILRHVATVRSFDVPAIVSINRYADDDPRDLEAIRTACLDAGVEAVITDFREGGGEGGLDLAELATRTCISSESPLQYRYPLEMPLTEKVETIAREIYGAAGVEFTASAKKDLRQISNLGLSELPVCMAKTPLSLTDNPKIPGCPSDFTITVTGARVSAGAGFVVVSTGKIMTMPGLPARPAALDIDIDDHGTISGLF